MENFGGLWGSHRAFGGVQVTISHRILFLSIAKFTLDVVLGVDASILFSVDLGANGGGRPAFESLWVSTCIVYGIGCRRPL